MHTLGFAISSQQSDIVNRLVGVLTRSCRRSHWYLSSNKGHISPSLRRNVAESSWPFSGALRPLEEVLNELTVHFGAQLSAPDHAHSLSRPRPSRQFCAAISRGPGSEKEQGFLTRTSRKVLDSRRTRWRTVSPCWPPSVPPAPIRRPVLGHGWGRLITRPGVDRHVAARSMSTGGLIPLAGRLICTLHLPSLLPVPFFPVSELRLAVFHLIATFVSYLHLLANSFVLELLDLSFDGPRPAGFQMGSAASWQTFRCSSVK